MYNNSNKDGINVDEIEDSMKYKYALISSSLKENDRNSRLGLQTNKRKSSSSFYSTNHG